MIKPYKNNLPQLAEQVYIAKKASVIGNVTLGKRASVWFGTVIRGDNAAITIGEDTNIQDNSTLHCAPGMPLQIGSRVTVGHNVVLHSCTVEDDCLIGMGAVIMNHAVIGKKLHRRSRGAGDGGKSVSGEFADRRFTGEGETAADRSRLGSHPGKC